MTFTSRKLSCAHPSAPQGRDVCESLKIIKLELELEKGTVSRHGRLGSHRGPKSKSAKSIANLLESLQSSLETSNLLHEGEEGIFFS